MGEEPGASLVGFGLLPNQVYRKAVRKGFEFSLMVVGESGLGKSTLVNSMFLTDIYRDKEGDPSENCSDQQTLTVEAHKIQLEENGVRLSLTVVDTPGYGDNVDNTDCWTPIISYIEEQFEDFLEAETRVHRTEVSDSRVHACLYFIAPTGHGLKPLDIEFLKRIHNMVNIIPVIGKSDSCTPPEIKKFKTKILTQLETHQIQIYSFPETELDQDIMWMRSRLPFAVVGSNVVITDPETGKKFRGREYPWGTVNIENQEHCDFSSLRSLVLAHHMQDLREVTHNTHYENFRCSKLRQMVENMEIKDEDLQNSELSDLGLGDDERLEMMEGAFEKEVTGSLYGQKEQDWDRRDVTNELKHFRDQKTGFVSQKKALSQSVSLKDLKPRSMESIMGGKKFRGLVTSLNRKMGK